MERAADACQKNNSTVCDNVPEGLTQVMQVEALMPIRFAYSRLTRKASRVIFRGFQTSEL